LGTGLEDASTHFLQPFKNASIRRLLDQQNMPKNAYFYGIKFIKIASASEVPLPNPRWPLAAGVVTTLWSAFLALNALYYYITVNKSNGKCSAFAFYFLLSNPGVTVGGTKIFFAIRPHPTDGDLTFGPRPKI